MKKRITLVPMLLLRAALLCSCSGQSGETKLYDVVTNADSLATQNVLGMTNQQSTVTAAAAVVISTPVTVESDYEAMTPAPPMSSEYAGATPVVIDPIDKPTPTPLPAITFNYITYDATRLHLSFEAPTGWIIDDSADDTYTITNPATNVDYQANLTVRVFSVGSNYTKSELKTEVTNMLSTLKSMYYTFSSTKTAERTLLDKDGVYADYSATLSDGTAIKGRVHVTCVDKKVYMVLMSSPAGYYETYKDTMYAKFRSTIKITQ